MNVDYVFYVLCDIFQLNSFISFNSVFSEHRVIVYTQHRQREIDVISSQNGYFLCCLIIRAGTACVMIEHGDISRYLCIFPDLGRKI